MKVQKRFLRKYKEKDYYKYVVNIPPLILREAGFREEENIEIKAEKGRIVLKKKKNEQARIGFYLKRRRRIQY